jgi:hypothetical protein
MYNDFDKIDKLAKDSLRDFEMDFNPEDWKKMEARLDKKEHRMPKIFLLKTIEASLILLVLFTAFNVFYYQNVVKASNDNKTNVYPENQSSPKNVLLSNKQKADYNNQLSENQTKNEAEKNTENRLNNFNKSENKTFKTNNNYNSKTKTGTLTNQSSNINNKFASESNSSKQSNQSFNNFTKSSNDNNQIVNNINSNNNSIKLSDDNFIASEFNKKNDNSANSFDDLNLASLATIKKIQNNKKNIDGNGDPVEEGKAYTLKNGFKFPKLFHRQLRAAAFAGADMNFANGIGNENVGFSFGVFMEYEISNRFALRTGILSSRKNFSKTYNTILDRTAEEGVIYYSKIDQNTGLSVFSVPVLFNGIIISNEKWRIGALAGPALSLLTHRFVSGEKRTNMMQSSGNVTAITDLNPADFEKGLLQGAKAENNIFISAMFGFEIERQLGNRVSLFIQPLYTIGLTKVGEEKDRLQNVSINVGIKGVIK